METTKLNGGGVDRLTFSIGETARMLGISEGLVRLEITRGHLNPHRIGRRVVLSRTDIDAYLARNQVERTPQRRHQKGARTHGERV
jgi:excisionase family DNA binding protein